MSDEIRQSLPTDPTDWRGPAGHVLSRDAVLAHVPDETTDPPTYRAVTVGDVLALQAALTEALDPTTVTNPDGGLTFFMPCVPPTANHQRKRIVRVGKWTTLADKPELNAAKDMLDSLLLPHQPTQPIAGPVALSLHWEWPWRASESKKRRALGQVPHTSRPDLSNLAKTLEDRLVALRFIEDDNAVVDLRLTKTWGDRPGITVALRPVVREG